MSATHLERTPIVDFDHPAIEALIANRRWSRLTAYDRIGAAYTFVKDEIQFGYNRSDDLPASGVLLQGYGQCNTKGNLLMALLRALDVPCRIRGLTIHKRLQCGAIPRWLCPLAPARILHSWVEVRHDNAWIPLEGFILDAAYLGGVQRRFADHSGPFCGYGVATPDLHHPRVEWQGEPTYIQRDGIADDFGLFDHPDHLYAAHGTNLRGLRRVAYQLLFRHVMNAAVDRIRQQGRQLMGCDP